MAFMIDVSSYDAAGRLAGMKHHVHGPEFLDWMPIEAKIFWFLERGDGDPTATHLLFTSQGEQRLVTLTKPLRKTDYTTMKGLEDGLQDATERYIDREGLSRAPRNQ